MEEHNRYYLFLKYLIKSYLNGNIRKRLPLQNKKEKALSIVLNGPSVNRTIQHLNKEETDIMMANYAPLTSLYKQLKPKYICFADLYFKKNNEKNRMLWNELAKSGDRVTVFLPHFFRKPNFVDKNLNIQYIFSPTQITKYYIFSYKLLEQNIVAPVYYNVAIMCIYVAIQLGYKKIYLYGADQDFMKELSVDKNNKVMRESVHFYGKETFCENKLHKFDMETMMYMGYMTFHGLKKLQHYALRENVNIINMSDSSWIDFFARYHS